MKAPFSPYLKTIKPALQNLLELLQQDYDYVSILATDSTGLAVRISQRARSVSTETMTTERGIVVRVARSGLYSEYALNTFNPDDLSAACAEILEAFDAQQRLLEETGIAVYETPLLPDEQ